MNHQILSNLDNPAQLEKLYRTDKTAFKHAFNALYPEIKDKMPARYWKERLNYSGEEMSWGSRKELLIVISAAMLAGAIAKIPAFFPIDEEFFYTRNISFIIFPLLTAYFAWKSGLSLRKIALLAVSIITGLVFINSLPVNAKSDTLVLSCLHLPLFLWSVLRFAFVGDVKEKKLGFLTYNGDLLVITALILISGGILSAITVGLFSLIGFNIEAYYFKNVGVVGLAAAPIVGTFLTQANPLLVGRVSPVIARIFSPLVLVMLTIYLCAILYSGKDPYNDREFLMLFNGLLVGVMALIFFSVAETSGKPKHQSEIWILFLLSVLTIIVNGIALSAIGFRIAEWGFTPNRTAVLGANVLVLGNLLLVSVQLFRVLTGKGEIAGVGRMVSLYLPVYFIWTAVVTFLFPLLFGFR